MKRKDSVPYSHKQLAVYCFNQVWEFLDKRELTDADKEEMVHLCHTSLWHWNQVENHTSQNLSVGYWQLSRVYSVVGNGEQALIYGQKCLTVSTNENLEPFYVAYAYEALARATMNMMHTEKAKGFLELAKKYKKIVEDIESRNLLEVDLKDIEEGLNSKFHYAVDKKDVEMNYTVSKNIGFQVENVEEAKLFYENVLGLKHPEQSFVNEVEFRTDNNSIFLIKGTENLGPVMEIFVNNLEEAKNHLLTNGFEIVRWEGKGKDCYVKDPFGMIFNVWEIEN
ncbi:VOC family protein [Rossellomorea aquimaris]|uniref:VOC family protein n=1 Tax=Rossellomorea aquimaris TaxID=189382 RepID=UPI000B0B31D3|nr:VOC family protein [Rossellomorea aquimaris]